MSMNNIGGGKVVCVTGGSGFIASWIVKFLLQRGYTVRATVRDPSNPKKVDHLLKLDGAKERLQLFKAELMEEGSFESAIEGCDGVFHTASPVLLGDLKDPQGELIDPAVKGTVNVLESCAKSASVKRVVLTSSMAAVACNRGLLSREPIVFDETCFGDPDFCREGKGWYPLAKILTEEAAREFAKRNKIDLISIHPTLVAGPLLQPEVNKSVEPILNLIKGVPTFQNESFGLVNVKDVAIAHILAYENASASGRYCLVERVMDFSEVVKILSDMFPSLQISEKYLDKQQFEPIYQFSKEKAESLGIKFTSLEETIKETVESFREKKIIDF